MEAYMGNRGMAPLFLNLGSRWRWAVILRWPPCPQWRSCWNRLCMRFFGTHLDFMKKRNVSCTLDHPVCSLIGVLIELSRLWASYTKCHIRWLRFMKLFHQHYQTNAAFNPHMELNLIWLRVTSLVCSQSRYCKIFQKCVSLLI
jgi:hypothetical protein